MILKSNSDARTFDMPTIQDKISAFQKEGFEINSNMNIYRGRGSGGECTYYEISMIRNHQITEPTEENQSIKFAEWLSKGHWQKRTATHPNKVG